MARSPTSFVNQNFADSLTADDKSKENPPQPHPHCDTVPGDTESPPGEEDATVDEEGAAASVPVIVVDSVRENGNRTAEEEAGHYTTIAEEEGTDEQWVAQPAVLSDEATACRSSNTTNGDHSPHRPLPHSSPPLPSSQPPLPKPILPKALRTLSDSVDFDLEVKVVGREKVVASKTDTYISYKIEAKSARPKHQFSESEYIVWRRYRDFEWLHQQLEKNYPTYILPPLPGKQLARYFDHMSDTFLDERQRALSKFLWRLAVHPFFSYDDSFKVFVTASTEDFAVHVAEMPGGRKILGKVTASVRQAATSLKLKNPDPEFSQSSKYFSTVADKTGVLERVETRLHSDREELSSVSSELSTMLFSLASLEPQLSSQMRMAGNIFSTYSDALKKLNERNTCSFLMAMKESQLYAQSGVSAVKRRDTLQLEYETLCEDREKKKVLHDEAVQSDRTEKIEKSAAALEKVGMEAENALDLLTKANEGLRVDTEKWLESKDHQWLTLMQEWAGYHMSFHRKMFSRWEELMLLLQEGADESSSPPLPVLSPQRSPEHKYESLDEVFSRDLATDHDYATIS